MLIQQQAAKFTINQANGMMQPNMNQQVPFPTTLINPKALARSNRQLENQQNTQVSSLP